RILFTSVHSQFGGRFRYIVSGGAALDPAIGEAWRELGVDVLQGYGLSETAPALTFNRLDRNRFGSVGVPVPGVQIKIADDGEVLAKGPNVFIGYWENDEATRAALDGEWFHTGDLGKFDDDGFLWLHGRKKDMIALPDGQKVYPDDVDAEGEEARGHRPHPHHGQGRAGHAASGGGPTRAHRGRGDRRARRERRPREDLPRGAALGGRRSRFARPRRSPRGHRGGARRVHR